MSEQAQEQALIIQVRALQECNWVTQWARCHGPGRRDGADESLLMKLTLLAIVAS